MHPTYPGPKQHKGPFTLCGVWRTVGYIGMALESSLPYTICLLVHEKRPEIFVCSREMIKVYWMELLKNLERRRHASAKGRFLAHIPRI